MKRVSNIKDSIMMPPPKARLKSRSDTSEELRRNLTETNTINSAENMLTQEDLSKSLKELDDNDNKPEEELSQGKSSSSINFDKINNSHHNNSSACNLISLSPSVSIIRSNKMEQVTGAFNFNLVHHTYNSVSDEEENSETQISMEKLRKNLTSNNKYKLFNKLPLPQDKKEVRIFVENMLSYLNIHNFDSAFSSLKIKLQTRFNDYNNRGLKAEYFKRCLMKMQDEVISRIYMLNETGKIIDNDSYDMLKKKRKRNKEDDMKSVTSSPSSSGSLSSSLSETKSIKSNQNIKIRYSLKLNKR